LKPLAHPNMHFFVHVCAVFHHFHSQSTVVIGMPLTYMHYLAIPKPDDFDVAKTRNK